jgi:hypothetical protein
MTHRGLLPGLPGSFPGGFPGNQPGGNTPPLFPGGGPGSFPGGPGSFPGGGPSPFPGPPPGGTAGGAPQSPPPSFVPAQSPQLTAVDPGSIRNCLFRYVYIWQNDGEQYWMYLTFVGHNSISGYRWIGIGPIGYWFFFGLDIRRISQFFCY